MWSRILHTFAMLLMILNSSMNILFYGIFNAQFRKVASTFLRRGNQASVITTSTRQPITKNTQEPIELDPAEPVEV